MTEATPPFLEFKPFQLCGYSTGRPIKLYDAFSSQTTNTPTKTPPNQPKTSTDNTNSGSLDPNINVNNYNSRYLNHFFPFDKISETPNREELHEFLSESNGSCISWSDQNMLAFSIPKYVFVSEDELRIF